MKQLFIGTLTLFASIATQAQVLYNNGAAVFIGTGTTLQVNGNLVNNTGNITNNGTLTTTGNITNNSILTAPTAGALQLNGTTTQTLSGTQPVIAKGVVVNNAAGITLATPLRIDGAVTFSSGVITATNSTYPVVFSANGTVGNTPTNASHVNGYVIKEGTGIFIYPLGNATNYQPVGVNLTANSGGLTALYIPADAGTAPFGTGGTDAAPLVQYNPNEYWNLTPVGTATGSVTVYYDSYRVTPISMNTTDLRVAHKYNGQWLNEGRAAGSTGNNISGTIISNAVSTWSPFSFGAISQVILPVKLVDFTAAKQTNTSLLIWKTVQEDNIVSYVIERSADGRRFTMVGSVASLGNTTTTRSYSFTDAGVLKGANYYRLKIIEKDGRINYSEVRLLNWGNTFSIALYPNPTKDKATLTGTEAGMTIRLLDAVGKLLRVQQASGTTENILLGGLSKGVYSVQTYTVDGKLVTTTQLLKE